MEGIKVLDGKIGYRHIPKVACTSIKRKMYEFENGLKFNREYVGRDVHSYFSRFDTDISDCKFRFLVVRDPVKRLLSAYSNRVGHHKELAPSYLNEALDKKLISKEFLNVAIPNPGLGQFIEFLELYREVPTINWHVKSIHSFVPDISGFTDVYPMERISDFQNKLSKLTEHEVIFERSQVGGRKISLKELDSRQLEFLISYYQDDYELLKDYYSADSLWKEWKKP